MPAKASAPMIEAILPAVGPAPVGPYSPAVLWDGVIYVSGQVPRDAASGQMISGDAATETRAMLENARAILSAAGASFTDVLKTTIFLTDMSHFAAMNTVYAEYFSPPYPARSTIGVSTLPMGATMEIELIVRRP